MIEPTGVFEVGGLPIGVTPRAHTWKVVFAGVPEGFEPGLSRVDERSFVIERGPFGGAVIAFDDPDTGHMGPIPIRRLDHEYQEPPGFGLEPPSRAHDAARDRAFQGILDKTKAGDLIVWDIPYPKHEFLRWTQGLDRFIFHSSTNTAIEVFQPHRNSVELADHGGRGNLNAVYGTHDAYWSMFFGIVDRDRLRGSMRNGVYRWEAPDGRTATTYQFSLEEQCLAGRPFTKGAVYILPRDTFSRLPYYSDGPVSEEWASEKTVRPVASLPIIPADFPFLERIAGHDETAYLTMLARFREVLGGVTSYEEDAPSGLKIGIAWSEEMRASFEAWRALAERFLPVVDQSLEGDSSHRTLRLDGPTPYLLGVKKRLDELLAGEHS